MQSHGRLDTSTLLMNAYIMPYTAKQVETSSSCQANLGWLLLTLSSLKHFMIPLSYFAWVPTIDAGLPQAAAVFSQVYDGRPKHLLAFPSPLLGF